MGIKQVFGQDYRHLLARISVVSLYGHIGKLGAYAKRGVAGQCPRSSSPCQEIRSSPPCHFRFGIFHAELAYHRQVFHVTVTTRLVQLMRTESRACRRRIGLDSVTFVQQSFLVKLLQQPPEGFDVTVIVSDVRVFHVHPITHFVGQVFPFLGEFHHILAACSIVVGHRNGFPDIFFRDAQRFLHAQFHRQPVRVPTGFALYLVALHGFVTAEDVLNGTRHDVVDARHSVGRGGAFIKHKRRTPFTFRHTAGENPVLVPLLQHFLVDVRKVERGILSKFLTHLYRIVLIVSIYNMVHTGLFSAMSLFFRLQIYKFIGENRP